MFLFNILFLFIGLNSSYAETENPIIANFNGVDAYGEECSLVVRKMNSWEGEYVIWFQGAENAGNNFRIELKPIPDEEMIDLSTAESNSEDITLNYTAHGVLIQKHYDDSESSFLQKYIVNSHISIEASADLSSVRSAYGIETVHTNFRTETVKELGCTFE